MKPNRLTVVLITVLFFFKVHAQLNADFSMDHSGGCAPLAVRFTNNTSGASSSATYTWDFGNGNKAILKDPAAIFQEPQSYTVTLTVSDGNKKSVKSQTIIVYNKPLVDFEASPVKGCIPLEVNFKSKSQPGDGTISNLMWGFGDGKTSETTSEEADHLYTEPTKAGVSLTVTNSHGCQSTLLRPGMITVLPSLEVSFNPKDSFLCNITDPAVFINASKGPGTLRYEWDFGDGQNSTEKNPSHVFSNKGTYRVVLKAYSSEGCTTEAEKKANIYVANYKSEINEELICRNDGYFFKNLGYPMPDSSFWTFENLYTVAKTGTDSAAYTFKTKGAKIIKLTNKFGSCIEKTELAIDVKEIPDLKGFIFEKEHECGQPVKVNFKDTTADAIKWLWQFTHHFAYDKTSVEKNPSFSYEINDLHYPTLIVTNAAGCKATKTIPLQIRAPGVTISTPDRGTNGSLQVCGKKKLTFTANCSEPGLSIKSFDWDFGDGSTLTGETVVHEYASGDYRVTLKYTLSNGCTGKVQYDEIINVRTPPKVDFSFSSVNICGNTPVTITNKSWAPEFVYFLYDMGDGRNNFLYNNQSETFEYKYENEGVFTVTLIATNGVCADTLTKLNYVSVKPPFPKIESYKNTCEGTRGEVTFKQSSRQTESRLWDFGDGTTANLLIEQEEVKHTYTKTGTYHAFLTNKNGACTVKDSIWVSVLLKQNPILTASKTQVCVSNEEFEYQVSNLERNPAYNNSFAYDIWDWHYSDGSYWNASGFGDADRMTDVEDSIYRMRMWNFDPGKTGFRMVTHSIYFGCPDTTNFIPLKVKGPIPEIFIKENKPCETGNTVYFQAGSKNSGDQKNIKWIWDFGDGSFEEHKDNKEFSHKFPYPDWYYIRLTVVDAAGCEAQILTKATAEMNSLKAQFSHSATTISPGTKIDFLNSSVCSDPDNTTYEWLFGDGSKQSSFDASKTYVKPGKYNVKLIAKNLKKGCTDTMSVTITVNFVNAAFSVSSSFIENSKCPPVLVSFFNKSQNITKLSWDFGDGTIVENVVHPNHIYTKPGKYYIVLKTWSDNGTLYTTRDSIDIQSSFATFNSSKLHTCVSQGITMNAKVENVSSYLWDFGDGTVVPATDTFANHLYRTPGIYNPRLIFSDPEGCASVLKLSDPIEIDSLSVNLDAIPASVCSPKEILLMPAVTSIGGSQSPQNLKYHWTFGNTDLSDTSNLTSPTLQLNKPGIFPVKLKVNSVFGCSQTVTKNVLVSQGLGGFVTGPKDICIGESVSFKGGTQLPGQPGWQWNLPDGSKSFLQNTQPIVFNTAGIQQIQLIVNNNGCSDTIRHSIVVHPKPLVTLSEKAAVVCKGSGLSITVSGGVSYNWSVPGTSDSYEGATILVSPLSDRYFVATVKNEAGCSAKDSVFAKVVQPFNLVLEKEARVCKGESVQLNASGAYSYLWINQTTGLNSTVIANPLARPFQNVSYTVVGRDQYSCFADTASVQVAVVLPPQVNIGADITILAGAPFNLQPTVSNDARTYQWSPAKYLSCTDCAFPIATPSEPISYILTVTNAHGCKNSDTIHIDLLCGESKIYIPNIFTPNHDGKNDQFSIKGQGINEIRYLRVYNRFGQMIFEKKNFGINDPAGAWDGTYKGKPVDPGTYIYMTELSCNDKSFTRKGTVTISY